MSASARRRPAPVGMSEVEQLVAFEQIRQLAARYALAVNLRDLDALVELFVDDIRAGRDRSAATPSRRASAGTWTRPSTS
jgi:ketosteroid isomerase-like protein